MLYSLHVEGEKAILSQNLTPTHLKVQGAISSGILKVI